MFTFLGSKQGFCDGVNRRNFLKIGAFCAGLTLADMLRLQAQATTNQSAPSRPKSAIMIYLPGGPSHMDMYDLKPDAPAEFRGEFRPIQTNVNGVQICEHFPLQARMWDKFAAIRSVVSVDEHSDSLVMTGKSQRENMTANHPSFGSVVSRVRSAHASAMPSFVSLRGMSRGTEPGFLGIQHRPFSPNGPGVDNLRPLQAVSAERMADRRAMLESFDNLNREVDANAAGLDNFTARAFEMVSSGGVRNALDLNREPNSSRSRYQGVESFLTARRLVEAGVGCVTMSYGGWDTHGQNFQSLRRQLPNVDKGLSLLVQDLHDRGLSNDVVVVMWGEFGRTPRVNNNAGRDHWSPVMSALIAGGGLRMGQAIGASTSRGERPQDRRYTVPQVLATLYHAIGINPATTFLNGTGRPIHIVEDRTLVRELV